MCILFSSFSYPALLEISDLPLYSYEFILIYLYDCHSLFYFSGKLANDIELQKHRHAKSSPLIVVCNGQTYTIKELAPKKAIMSIIHRSIQHHQQRIRNNSADEDDDIYWLKPKPPSRKQSPETEHLLWSGKKKNGSPGVKHKVTFEDSLSGSPRKVRGNIKSPKSGNKTKKQCVKFEDLTDTEDDGDYATLRDIPLIREVNEEHEEALEELLKVCIGTLKLQLSVPGIFFFKISNQIYL